ncbi:MAG TPA: hypothetical protein VGD52_20460 [Pseudoduganella sp.]
MDIYPCRPEEGYSDNKLTERNEQNAVRFVLDNFPFCRTNSEFIVIRIELQQMNCSAGPQAHAKCAVKIAAACREVILGQALALDQLIWDLEAIAGEVEGIARQSDSLAQAPAADSVLAERQLKQLSARARSTGRRITDQVQRINQIIAATRYAAGLPAHDGETVAAPSARDSGWPQPSVMPACESD